MGGTQSHSVAMASLSSSAYLHVGDRVSLYHEASNGFLGAEGFTNTQVAIDISDGFVSGDLTRNEVFTTCSLALCRTAAAKPPHFAP